LTGIKKNQKLLKKIQKDKREAPRFFSLKKRKKQGELHIPTKKQTK
jgi:hypothetical protein